MTHIGTPMADDEDFSNRLPRVRKAFADFYQLRAEDDSYLIINGAHVASIKARKAAEGWVLTFHMDDGQTHTLLSDWAEAFVGEVFGKHVLRGDAALPAAQDNE